MSVYGRGADRLPTTPRNLTYRAAQRLLADAGLPSHDLRLTVWQEVPLARGLGSSACAIVGGLVAANALLHGPLPQPRLLEMGAEMEGHPDNVAAALLGGCVVVVQDGPHLQAAPVPLPPDLQCVVFVPDQPLNTRLARSVLPKQFSREEAVFNIGRTALLVLGLATAHPEYLRVATEDRLHQPARQRVFPAMNHIFANALSAGAYGVFLSGAGSSVMALTRKPENRAMAIGYEMADAAQKAGAPGTFHVLEPSLTGAEVLAVDGEG